MEYLINWFKNADIIIRNILKKKDKEQTSDMIDIKIYKLQQLREYRNRQTDQWKRMDVRINENLVWTKGLISNYLCSLLSPCSANQSLRLWDGGTFSIFLRRLAPDRAI